LTITVWIWRGSFAGIDNEFVQQAGIEEGIDANLDEKPPRFSPIWITKPSWFHCMGFVWKCNWQASACD
jgi:hypothetical protein